MKAIHQCYGILTKNFLNHWSNKKKFFGEFIFPIIISGLYILMQSTLLTHRIEQKQQSPFIGIILGVLIKLQLSMIGLSAIKQLVTLFLHQRQKKYRQYQMIFGLGSRAHTLSNLFYMGLYMSFFLLPFYLTLNYYKFQLYYIGVFAAFVISTMASSMMLSSFFTDQKLATEIIGTLFSLSGFLVLMYSGGQNVSQNGQVIYTLVDRIAMFMPNSSFAIAIMYDSPWVSWYSISIVKIYLIVYSIMEFPREWKEMFLRFFRWIKNRIIGSDHNPQILTQDFNLNDQISQNFSPNNNDRTNVQTQNIMVKISNLVKTYKIKQGQFNALNRINMTIQKRQIFGLLGRNGAGKTTLVDILTGICRPSSGGFYINFQKNLDQDIQKIGICYQHQILYEDLTVQQHLYFYCRIKNVKADHKQTIESIVNMLKIQGEFKKKIKEISGGNKRKVSIAIAVLGNPEMMIFDQPTSGLDPLSRRAVWEILQQLKKDFNSSIILTTHHLDQAEVLSDWICVIEKGSVIVQNSPDQIKEKYGNGYYLTLEFLSTEDLQQTFLSINTYLENTLERVQILEKENNRVKLFLKFGKINMKKNLPQNDQTPQTQENTLLKILEWLNNIQHIKVEVQKNSLQQSFIAILKDPQNGIAANSSGDSIQLANVIQRPLQQRKTLQEQQNESIIQKLKLLCSQVHGIFIRCIYFHKGSSLRFFMTYNINIVIFVFAMLFNKFVLDVIQKSSQNENDSGINFQQQATKQQKYSNNMLILQGYIIMAGAFIIIPMYEKQKNIRRVFNSRGVWPCAYWLGNFVFDFGYYLLNLFLMSTFITPQSFIFLNKTQKGMFLFIQLGLGMIVYSYTSTTLFSKITTANTWFSILNMLFGFIMLPMIILGENTFLKYFSFVKYFYPYYDLNVILMKETMKGVTGGFGEGLVVKNDQQGQYIWFSIVFYLVVLIFVEIRIWDRVKELCWYKTRVDNCQHNIQLKNVCKKYDKLEALKDVTYHVGNQRLALLGHNGAGKSTTFGLLSGQINPTCGQLFLQHKTKLNHQKMMRSAGICYQQDCLWQNCSPLQILNIFSYLVPIQHSGKEIQWLLESLQFESMNFNKRFEQLSGGNKRKICMAVGLYGDPMIRLLDQCSTGLDPSSRVAMVETIKNSGEGSTIFTTHSMSQAQNLCSRTVIMGKGQVLEFDYIYKLKEKYYNCYWIDVVFKNMQMEIANQLQSKSSFVENNIELIKKQLKSIVYELRYQHTNGKQVDLYKSLPKILKATKQKKMRLQFDKLIWPIHIALKITYLFRDRLQSVKKDDFIQSIYISQPKLQDVYIRVTSDASQHENNSEMESSDKEYIIESEEFEEHQIEQRQLKSSYTPKKHSQEIQLMEI